MASPLTKLSINPITSRETHVSALPDAHLSGQHPNVEELLASLPCVIYECDASFQITRISPNTNDLLGIGFEALIGTRDFSTNRILREDLPLVAEKLNELDLAGSTSFICRLLDDRGLPIWITHSLRKISSGQDAILVRGCIIPLLDEKRVHDLERGIISRFVHKIGNHFQLLNLVLNSIKKALAESKETQLLQQTIEDAVGLTRAFSDYSQGPTWLSEVDLHELATGAAASRRSSFARKGIRFEIGLSESLHGVTVQGDPFLLEMALGNVLQNALEATEEGGRVSLAGELGTRHGKNRSVVILRIADTGCGIDGENLSKILVPFFTLKKNHDGLGLSMAARFVETHGGILQIESLPGKGTEVTISLPTSINHHPMDR